LGHQIKPSTWLAGFVIAGVLAVMTLLPIVEGEPSQNSRPTENAKQPEPARPVEQATQVEPPQPAAPQIANIPQIEPAQPLERAEPLEPALHAEKPPPPGKSWRAAYDALVSTHARANAVPEALVHRVILRESRYQPDLVGQGGTIGLMQIKLATARGLGYTGDAEGLRDPETNINYGVKYLAGAYRTANGDHDRAVHYYAAGYYEAAKHWRHEHATRAEPVLASAESAKPKQVAASAKPPAKPKHPAKIVADAETVPRPPASIPVSANTTNVR
jgi:soluble lytic murein transglycosylase-like protein